MRKNHLASIPSPSTQKHQPHHHWPIQRQLHHHSSSSSTSPSSSSVPPNRCHTAALTSSTTSASSRSPSIMARPPDPAPLPNWPTTMPTMASSSSPHHSSDDDSGYAMDAVYAWVPPNTNPQMVHAYFASLPADKVPRLGSGGEQWRLEALQRQMPAQDMADHRHQQQQHFCGAIDEGERGEESGDGDEAGRRGQTVVAQQFAAQRETNAMGRGKLMRQMEGGAAGGSKVYCHQCKCPIGADQPLVVVAPNHFGEDAAAHSCWHPGCFVCVECKELLVDLLYFSHNQNVFCGRHHAELFKPRCAGCDHLIFDEECTEAEGRFWHLRHFCCSRCGIQLGGHQYLMMNKDGGGHYGDDAQIVPLPCCLACFRLDLCRTCAKPIPAQQPHIVQGDLRWHTDGRCFCCSICQRPLLGKAYSLSEGGRLFCTSGRGCGGGAVEHGNGNVPAGIMAAKSPIAAPSNASPKVHQQTRSLPSPSTPLSPLPPPHFPSPSSSSNSPRQCPPPLSSPLANRAVRFNLMQTKAKPGHPPMIMAPPLPKNGPPPVPLINKCHPLPPSLVHQQQPMNSSPSPFRRLSPPSPSSENVYETVVAIPPSPLATVKKCITTTAATTQSTSSGCCSINGSLCSSAAGSTKSPLNCLLLPLPSKNGPSQHPYLDDLSSSSSSSEDERAANDGEEEAAGMAAEVANKVMSRRRTRRKCRPMSADGRKARGNRRKGGGGGRRRGAASGGGWWMPAASSTIGAAVQQYDGPTNAGDHVYPPPAVDSSATRRRRTPMREYGPRPFCSSETSNSSSCSSSSEEETSSEGEYPADGLFLRHYLAATVSAAAAGVPSQIGPKKGVVGVQHQVDNRKERKKRAPVGENVVAVVPHIGGTKSGTTIAAESRRHRNGNRNRRAHSKCRIS